MGKKKRLNRFITKWIKSDLPDDHSTVLLLGVTRIPTSPTAIRRPCSLPLPNIPSQATFPQNNPIIQHKSRKNSFQSRKNNTTRRSSSNSSRIPFGACKNHSEIYICAISDCPSILKSDNNKLVAFDFQNSPMNLSTNTDVVNLENINTNSESDKQCSSASSSGDVTPCNFNVKSSDLTPVPVMDRSVDSIGACSLDAEASVELTDWSEQSSVGTLRSLSLPTPEPQPHQPSYLSLACTVSGYSITTNYDPERLAKSRDASPHRINDDLNSLQSNSPFYSVRNNLLSPPNIVPLPHQKYMSVITEKVPKDKQVMEEQVITRREFYSSSTRTRSYINKESRNVTNMFSSDVVDDCVENGHQSGIQSKCVSYENKSLSYVTNGTGKVMSKNTYKEFANGVQQKSFIQQRVERLYGPGALAHGFFISKRQQNRLSESEVENISPTNNEFVNDHAKSALEKESNLERSENNLKQSISSPTLPVLRHLRPEFRAQLPIITTKKNNDALIPKSVTVPSLKEEIKINGNSENSNINKDQINGINNVIAGDDVLKDGHYFLRILEIETNRLLKMADYIENELLLPEDLSEEIKGKLRSASGKARLLTSQKMQQFKGLCTNNITQKSGEVFPTTNEDLQGFWDMVLLQVEQVDALFKEIDELKANNWEEIEPKIDETKNGVCINKPRKVVNKSMKSINTVNEAVRKEREAKRKQLIEERRKAMREQKQNMKQSIEIFVPELS